MIISKIILLILTLEISGMFVEGYLNDDPSGIGTFLFVLLFAGTLLTWPILIFIERRVLNAVDKSDPSVDVNFKKHRAIVLGTITVILILYIILLNFSILG